MHVYVLTLNTAHEGDQLVGIYTTLPRAMGTQYADWYEDYKGHWIRKGEEDRTTRREITQWTVDADYDDDGGEVSEEFKAMVRKFIDDNAELLRRLAKHERPPRLIDARDTLVCRRLVHQITKTAHRDWPWSQERRRSCQLEEGPL